MKKYEEAAKKQRFDPSKESVKVYNEYKELSAKENGQLLDLMMKNLTNSYVKWKLERVINKYNINKLVRNVNAIRMRIFS